MKVKLLVDWAGKKAGAEMDLADAKAKRVIATGLVEKVNVRKPKAVKSKGDTDGSITETV